MLNHPRWSQMQYPDYIDLKGLWGVECHNNEAAQFGDEDWITPVDDLLKKGERVIPTATDDAHDEWASYGGWMMIKSETLKHEDIFDAMKRGDCYASAGPEIKELWIEDGLLHIETSPCKKIITTAERRINGWKHSNARPDEYLTWAEQDISNFIKQSRQGDGYKDSYFRVTVTDEWGRKAYTRAYFLDELIK